MARFAVAIALLVAVVAIVNAGTVPDFVPLDTPCSGGPNDVRVKCGSQCPLTCEKPEPGICILSCNINVCQCKQGFVRRSDGQCVTVAECSNNSAASAQA